MSAPVIEQEVIDQDMTPGHAPLLSCAQLSKHYGSTRALAGLDLEVFAGPPVALVGPNGAGKTTLLSLIAGYVRPSGGTLAIFGERAGSPSLAGRLAAVPQDALLDPRLSIAHQLTLLARLQGFARQAARAEALRVLGMVGLEEVAGRRPTVLSHGMRKRVALAQAFIGAPALVLLDEPTAGIDPENARAIREAIAQRAHNTTFVVSSHNLDELERMCGSVIQLERGELVRHEPLSISAGSGAHRQSAPVIGSKNVASTATGEAPSELTLRLDGVPAAEFETAVLSLKGVNAARQLTSGDWRIDVADETAVAKALFTLLAERRWAWRHIVRGRSLEERLYGGD